MLIELNIRNNPQRVTLESSYGALDLYAEECGVHSLNIRMAQPRKGMFVQHLGRQLS